MKEQINITYRPYRCLGILLAICGLVTTVWGAEKGDVVVVASTESPPYRMFEGGPPRGVFIDILEAVLRQANLTPHYQVLPFKRCLAELKTGTSDLFIGLFYRPEREAYLIYLKPTIAPYVTKVFYLNKGRAQDIQKWEDLYRIRIGIRAGSTSWDIPSGSHRPRCGLKGTTLPTLSCPENPGSNHTFRHLKPPLLP